MSDIFKPGDSPLAKVERGLKKMENELYQESAEVVYSVVKHTFDLDPSNPELPEDWQRELDGTPEDQKYEKALELARRRRIAEYALQSPKNAPVALQIAAKVMTGMMKARAMEGQGDRTLNVNVVTINQPSVQYEEKEIDVE